MQTLNGIDRQDLCTAERSPRLEVLQEIQMVMHKPSGGRVEVGLLRSPQWIADYGAHVGGTVWLNMPEMGVEGLAEVLDIGPPQVYDVRPGLVTGTFRYTSGEVYDLKLESESKPIGVTGTHPFWSADREAWVSVLDLAIGETLKTLEGTTVVESRVRRPEPEPVYNIEVDGDHCYRVGESGVLVHNASVPDDAFLCYDSCQAAEADIGIPSCDDVFNAKSGHPDTACQECNPDCPTCRAVDAQDTSPRSAFHPHGQKHWNCAPQADPRDLRDSIVCGRCCVEIDGQPYARQKCICQPK